MTLDTDTLAGLGSVRDSALATIRGVGARNSFDEVGRER